MVQPTPVVIASHRLKKPEEFTREQFGKLMVKVHRESDVRVVEKACFMEPHEGGRMHHNYLVRADTQCRWEPVAEKLFQKYRVSVSFGSNIKSSCCAQGFCSLCGPLRHFCVLGTGSCCAGQQLPARNGPYPIIYYVFSTWVVVGSHIFSPIRIL